MGVARSFIEECQDLLADTEMDLEELMEREEEILRENEERLEGLFEDKEKIAKKLEKEADKDFPDLEKLERLRLKHEEILLEMSECIRAIVIGRENIAGCELELEY